MRFCCSRAKTDLAFTSRLRTSSTTPRLTCPAQTIGFSKAFVPDVVFGVQSLLGEEMATLSMHLRLRVNDEGLLEVRVPTSLPEGEVDVLLIVRPVEKAAVESLARVVF